MFLSFCSALFSSLVSIQWLCLFLTIPMFRFDPSDVYRATLKWSRVFDLPDNSYHTRKLRWQVWSYTRNLNLVILFFFVANHRVMVFRCVTIQELSGDNYRCSYPYWFCNICLITENGSIIFLLRPTEFRTEECSHGTRWSVRPTYKSEIFGCTQKKRKSFHPTLSDMFTR